MFVGAILCCGTTQLFSVMRLFIDPMKMDWIVCEVKATLCSALPYVKCPRVRVNSTLPFVKCPRVRVNSTLPFVNCFCVRVNSTSVSV